ncbi:MAG: hypothetical protein GWN16_07615, partial [Calditrichae bacterium]|nr:hypothetical protein [Calditrichia bacterium]
MNAGFKVPPGFLLPTEAYEEFVSQNNLSSQIESIIRGTDLSSPEALEEASKQIRLAFSKGVFSEKLRRSLLAGWKWLGDGPVAVRSSATAEDLPDMSFAGQQDTFLNVIGEKDLLEAVVNCWSSLWTARAIGYRTRNKIPHSDVSLSVVVQQMIQSYSSGVLFTANPLTGLRKEVVIDATIGLGEALVSGQVEPDHYVINSDSWVITTISLGKKSLVIHGQSEGGVQFKNADSSQIQALPKDVIIELSKIGKEIEALYGFPQDIEWAWAEGNLYILQSRPITSLFPMPEVLDSDHLQVFFSFGAVQGLLDPMTPLGQDAIRMIFAGASRLFGYYDLNQHTQRIFEIAGERLWANFTPIIRNPIGSKMILKLFPGIEPGSIDALKEILSDPKIGAGSGRIRLKSLIRMIKFAVPMLGRMLYFAHKPER